MLPTIYEPNQELRFYCLVNYYLSSIQQGIQTGHCAVELCLHYLVGQKGFRDPSVTPEKVALVRRWAETHKTFIVLNGGDAESIESALDKLIKFNELPFACFRESESALKGMITGVGVVLPECLFNVKPSPRPDGEVEYVWQPKDGTPRVWTPDHPYHEIIKLVKSCGLAR